jgi:hypothetical protein
MSVRRMLQALAPVAVVAAISAAGAVAYFTAPGSGGSAGNVAVSLQAVTLSGGTASSQLYPGGSADVAVTVSNPNSSPVRIGSLQLDTTQGSGGFAVDGAHSGCSTSALQLAAQTGPWTVPANGSLPIDLANAISMGAGAANACQGASFTVYLKAGS